MKNLLPFGYDCFSYTSGSTLGNAVSHLEVLIEAEEKHAKRLDLPRQRRLDLVRIAVRCLIEAMENEADQ